MFVVTTCESDRRFGALLRETLGGGLLDVETRDAAFYGTISTPILVRGSPLFRISCENVALIVHGNGCIPDRLDCKNAIAIVDSADTALLGQVAARRLRALTCGRRCSDTFTFSSLTADSAVISLQRPITTFGGIPVEPFELPVRYREGCGEPFWLLACAAVACLAGNTENNM